MKSWVLLLSEKLSSRLNWRYSTWIEQHRCLECKGVNHHLLIPHARVGGSSNRLWRILKHINDEVCAWIETTRIQFNWWLGENYIWEGKGGESILFNVVIYWRLTTKDVCTRGTIVLNWPCTILAKIANKTSFVEENYTSNYMWNIAA
jgi:hypothetical protein